MRKPNTAQLRLQAEKMMALRTPDDVSRALGIPLPRLEALAANPAYALFTVPKRDGSQRLIENPAPALKAVQRYLNDLLQAVYYFEKPDAAYGFVLNPADDPHPRHIVTHAERHLGCRWLLNIDLEDFFHQVDAERTTVALMRHPLQLKRDAVALLARLSTWKGRLPMGAPSSPVLSNLAFREEDRMLTFRSRERGWLYTRYADDLTFSSDENPMTPTDLADTVAYIEGELGFKVHPEKRRFSGEGDPKSVTRLMLEGGQVALPDDFYRELDETLTDLGSSMRAQHKMGHRHTQWLDKYDQRAQGLLAFAQHVLGEREERYRELLQRYQSATTQNPEDFGAYSWLDFPYF